MFLFLVIITFSAAFAHLSENDDCIVPETGENGTCVVIHACRYGKQLLKNEKIPKICGFKYEDPMICCPKRVGLLSDQMCFKYFDPKYQVHAIDLGTKALSKEFPHMAAVGFGDKNTSILWLCGGTLISHYFVLSAAHCAESFAYGPASWIRLGDLDLKNTTEDADPLDRKIIEILVHPNYKNPSHYHDIALFRIKESVFFGLYFRPACLQTEEILPVSVLGATGWGNVGIFGDASSHLMKVDLKIVDYSVCNQKYATVSKRKLANGILQKYQMCAGDESGKDTCPGDSGGPLHYLISQDPKMLRHFVVAGITSFGKGCGGGSTAGVYTKVSAYVDWIERNIWPEI